MCSNASGKGLLSKLPQLIGKSPGLTQIAIGSITGLSTGYAVTKFGKIPVAVAGTAILIAQIAHSQGCGNMDWKKIKSKAQETTKTIDSKYNTSQFGSTVKQVTQTSPYFTAGFVGGFLIGVGI
ncbi:hypothetical protein RI129_001790 [Pyrocoelia pectoralis]|uniref:Uncharacterized protein n=1 Tax=Pyrocoelia pectoralis TaxID=417401 RepID=A0AAN7VVP2_9COLE